MTDAAIENIEISPLLEAVFRKYGYDFRSYCQATIRRKLIQQLSRSGIASISEMQYRLLHDVHFFEQTLPAFSINVTEMFRDPLFYLRVRRAVIPVLKTYPFIRIWHAGCATGEEVYSMAIILREEGLYERTRIYATDFNEAVLRQAKDGVFDIEKIRNYTANYQRAGGVESFADYYSAKYDYALIDQSLKKNIIFSNHDLIADGVFGEMNLIMCRNVLIYFNKSLQNRVVELFRDSLCDNGFLCLGSRESLVVTEYGNNFEELISNSRIYTKLNNS